MVRNHTMLAQKNNIMTQRGSQNGPRIVSTYHTKVQQGARLGP